MLEKGHHDKLALRLLPKPSNKMFENYQLDRTIVQDSEQNTHITTGYSLGDALVNSNPGRFQYLPKANLVKGVDF